MGFEKPEKIPEENELPLNISDSEALEHQGRESEVLSVSAENSKEKQSLILKRVRQPELSTLPEIKRSRNFYDFIKQDPKFGKFVLETLHFTARENRGENPNAYKIQKKLEGKRVDEMKDTDLYADENVSKQLLEFIDATIEVIEKANKTGKNTPDLFGDQFAANILHNPRYSSNIFITNKPDNQGRRVFLIDVNAQSQQVGHFGKGYQKHIGSKLQTFQLKRWKSEIEKRLKYHTQI